MKTNKDNRFFVIIILLIVVILILLFFMRFGSIQNTYVPTGNVDVFDIDIDCGCDDLSKCISTDENGNEYVIPMFNSRTDNKIIGKVFVDDVNGNYLYQQRLRIFTNAAYAYTDKVAPGVSNSYHFVVHNSTNINLKYKVLMYEESEYKVNLKYRLSRNNQYVVGDSNSWVSASELKTAFSNLAKKNSDSYALDWKWEYEDGVDEEDTLAGEKMMSAYKLNIRVYFEQV